MELLNKFYFRKKSFLDINTKLYKNQKFKVFKFFNAFFNFKFNFLINKFKQSLFNQIKKIKKFKLVFLNYYFYPLLLSELPFRRSSSGFANISGKYGDYFISFDKDECSALSEYSQGKIYVCEHPANFIKMKPLDNSKKMLALFSGCLFVK